ncbi:S-methyl-5'-thioinosine phosphorylase [Kineococcus sp. NBC_00420]|uniref:S-methyl-5'-thioinosine phosphorylase n=1 Tax=Kineococcus sp. NBC_00420 TaxID=2903564 RepID=UPI002E238AD6
MNRPLPRVAVIGGSGLYRFFDSDAEQVRGVEVTTPYGRPSGAVRVGDLGGRPVAFLARHGEGHTLPPHRIDYRANLWALASLGVRAVVTTAAVGGLSEHATPGRFAVPDQLIDRTHGRPDTFFDGRGLPVQHLPAADPYCPELRSLALDALARIGEQPLSPATSVVIQGPRFSTAAESAWFRSAGADLVNMTQYPEAVLAAELNVGLVNLAFITDRDAGSGPDTADASLVLARMAAAAPRILAAVRAVVAAVPEDYAPRELIDPAAVAKVLAA